MKRVPERMCVACRVMRPKRELIRVVKAPQGAVLLDATGKMSGRGAYLCPQEACLKKARKSRALERALSAAIDPSAYDALEQRLTALTAAMPSEE